VDNIIASTAAQAIYNSLQFNAQMSIFFASCVDPAFGGSYTHDPIEYGGQFGRDAAIQFCHVSLA
jgi:hypothetical protein